MPFTPAHRVSTFGTTIFAEMSRLAVEHGAINLGQGFPDFDGPDPVKEAAIAALRAGDNQYAVGIGQPALRRAIAAHAQRFYGQTVDPDAEITVTSGATEAIFSTILGLVNPGDGSANSYDEWTAMLTRVRQYLGVTALKKIHIHLSGIEYGPKGEKHHLPLAEADLKYKDLFKALRDAGGAGRILCESPKMEDDALVMQKAWKKQSAISNQ